MPQAGRLRNPQFRSSRSSKFFNPQEFLANTGIGRTIRRYGPKQTIFSQEKPGDTEYYIQEGRMQLSEDSKQGKKTTIAMLSPGDFLGEGCIASSQPVRMATAN